MRIRTGVDHCYYCQNKVVRDGVCAGHWQFLFKGMSNRDRMKEKAYHRQMRAEEFEAKLEEKLKQESEVTA